MHFMNLIFLKKNQSRCSVTFLGDQPLSAQEAVIKDESYHSSNSVAAIYSVLVGFLTLLEITYLHSLKYQALKMQIRSRLPGQGFPF
jgi:hypothetical protein